jgi:soluble lytic murein transglycosylase-like protein
LPPIRPANRGLPTFDPPFRAPKQQQHAPDFHIPATEDQGSMKKLRLVAVALAAGMTTFAAHAHDAPRDGGKIMAEALAAAKHKAPTEKRKVETSKRSIKKVASRGTRHGRRVVHNTGRLPGVDRTLTASIDKKEAASTHAERSAPRGESTILYGDIIDRYAREYGVAPSLARAVIRVESGYDAHKTGSAGEVGLMQIKPSTARMLGYSGGVKQLYDPETNIKWGMKYLGMAKEAGNGTTCGTLLKYNAGHAATHMNPISAAYCGRVKAELADAAT